MHASAVVADRSLDLDREIALDSGRHRMSAAGVGDPEVASFGCVERVVHLPKGHRAQVELGAAHAARLQV